MTRSVLGRALWLLAPVGLFAAVALRTAELSSLEAVVVSAQPLWLLTATLLAVAFAVNQGALYRRVFTVLDEEVTLGDAIVLGLVMAFASLAFPAGTASGIAYFVTTARTRGIPASRALLAGLAYYLFDYGALTPVLLAGMVVLQRHQDLGPGSLAALGSFYLAALTAAALVAWGLLRPASLAQVITRAGVGALRAFGRAGRRVRPERITVFAAEVQAILTAVRLHPRRAVPPFVHAAILQGLALALLATVFAALGIRPAPAVLLAGYAVGTVFMVISVTPSGVGVVEAAMTVTFASLGVDLPAAVSATVLFRLYTFWLPMLVGFLALRLTVPLPTAGSARERMIR